MEKLWSRVLATMDSDYDFALTRYNSNGSLDLGFDIDGIVTTPIGLGSSFGYAVAIQTDGKIVVAGTSYNGNDHDFAVTRYNSNGSLDLSFDTDGKANPLIGFGTEWKMTVAIQADGKIVAAGPINNGMNYDFGLARFNSDGSLDLSFDADGIVTTPIGITNDSGYSVAIQADGKIVVAGCLNNNGNTFDFALVRYNNTPTMVSTDLSGNCGQISIHPNPFSSTTIIKTDQLLKNATITIYNLFGEQIKQIENINVQSITLSRNNLPNGFYFIHLTQDNKVLSRKECLVVD
jgi:uncharacterized delta-60 repeat protein